MCCNERMQSNLCGCMPFINQKPRQILKTLPCLFPRCRFKRPVYGWRRQVLLSAETPTERKPMNTIDTVKATTYRALRKLATLIFAIGMLGSLPLAHASDAFSVTVDVDGSDDVPLQEDVTQMGFDTSHLSESDPYWSVFFAFDDVATTSASQTLDGCAFFDANKDGYADFSVCASLSSKVTGQPTTLSSA